MPKGLATMNSVTKKMQPKSLLATKTMTKLDSGATKL